MKEKDKAKKKKKNLLKDVLKEKLKRWNPELPKSPSSNTKTSA
ncbi:MAG TPA: hypothetical protein VFK44_15240 [Bacillales bacterium]|nr:hypothetical protein [Bacillales bacterium]